MKITRSQIRKIIKEANPDGTISDDEDNERDIFMADVEEQAEELVRFIQMEAERIGGGFRSPGIRREALRIVADVIHGER